VQRKLAASMAMVHTITMNSDLTVMRLEEVGGPLNSDITYTLDVAPMDTKIMKRCFKDTATWVEGANPPSLKIVRTHEDNDFSLVHTRYIEEEGGEPVLVLVRKNCSAARCSKTCCDLTAIWLIGVSDSGCQVCGPRHKTRDRGHLLVQEDGSLAK
jgi:hypothetical protein